ncbi:hypothetical protein EJ04DRAFT_79141 [Polyplosphaeria fusca]|uniref:Uncharacterized protein n=1 Tax=Polyplosphaeria fusca TaxID=682080 RepID=A0A9P4R7K1_9PLEO|nr:hypothetical protein EJ04DRAFT_79141 [Polyplosphaeria fusca]
MWNREGYNHIAASDTESQTISTFETNEAEIESHVYSCRGSQRLHWVYHGLLLTLNFLLLPFTLNFSYTSQSCVYKDSWWCELSRHLSIAVH